MRVTVTFTGDFVLSVRDQADADARGVEMRQRAVEADVSEAQEEE